MQSQDPSSTGNTTSSSQTGLDKKAREVADEARNAARDKAMHETEEHKHDVSNVAGAGAEALEQAADSLDEDGQETLAQTASSMASEFSEFARKLEHKNADELMQDASRLARRNPALFVLGGIGAGLMLSRFFKASSHGTERSNTERSSYM